MAAQKKRQTKAKAIPLVPISQRVAGVVEIFDNAITNCEEILAIIANGDDSWEEAEVGDTSTPGKVIKEVRDNQVRWIHPFNFNTDPLLFNFVKTVWRYLDDYGTRYERSFSNLESVNINRYLPGQQYHVHADAGGKSTRVISALVYLNDDFSGGETDFVYFDERITPKAGRLVIFPSNYAYAHAALPPLDGVKYSAAFWTNA